VSNHIAKFHELDLDRLNRRWVFNPLFPADNVFLSEWKAEPFGRLCEIEDWSGRLESALLSEWGHNFDCFGSLSTSDLDSRDCLCYSVTRLPEEVFRAAYRRLFGEYPKSLLSYRSLEIVGHALFQPPLLIKKGCLTQSLSWPALLQHAEFANTKRLQGVQQIKDLVATWGN